MNAEYVLVLTTLPADADAPGFGRALVEERLAACVNVLPLMESIYKWEGELQQELTDDAISDLMRFREAVAAGLDNPTPEMRRQWLEALRTAVNVTGGVATVTCRLGGEALQYHIMSFSNNVLSV